jgi:hypothetical protein
MDVPDDELQRRVAVLMGKRPAGWRRAHGGYTPAQRWVVTFADGSSCFVKAGTNAWTSDALRAEYERVYSRLEAPFLARLLAWDDDEDAPILILEDLSAAHWPPPWGPGEIDAVLDMLRAVGKLKIRNLPDVRLHPACQNIWPRIEAEPEDLLSVGLVSRSWLEDCLPRLKTASDQVPFAGEDVVHFDVRSDNLCFQEERCLLVDWNNASLGNGDLDLVTWLPSLEAEGGPPPETLFPDGGRFAAWMSGYWAWAVGKPPPPGGPRLREIQLSQLRSALPWAVRALGLPPLDGPNAP